MAGITCARCSYWKDHKRVEVKHATVAEIRSCGVRFETWDEPVALPPVALPPVMVDWSQIETTAKLLPQLRKMHYALLEADGDWHFYRVDMPTKGRWAGRVFIDAQASDDYWPVKAFTRKLAILEAIVADPEKAASDYGHEIGKCGICSRTLTNPESIAKGIGPICAGKAGW